MVSSNHHQKVQISSELIYDNVSYVTHEIMSISKERERYL